MKIATGALLGVFLVACSSGPDATGSIDSIQCTYSSTDQAQNDFYAITWAASFSGVEQTYADHMMSDVAGVPTTPGQTTITCSGWDLDSANRLCRRNAGEPEMGTSTYTVTNAAVDSGTSRQFTAFLEVVDPNHSFQSGFGTSKTVTCSKTACTPSATCVSCVACVMCTAGSATLTPAAPSATFHTAIATPGKPNHGYNAFTLDATAFASGGNLTISGTVGNPGCAASFNLNDVATPFTASGVPTGSLATAYDIAAGSPFSLSHRFNGPEVFRFGAEGNWLTTGTNTVSFTVNVGP